LAGTSLGLPPTRRWWTHYLGEVQKRKPTTGAEYYDLLGLLDPAEKKMPAQFQPMVKILDETFKNAGEFRGVKVIKVLKFGPMLRRAQYQATYANNVLVLDIWFVNSTKGWQLVKVNFPFGEDVDTSLAKIPAEFQTDAEGF